MRDHLLPRPPALLIGRDGLLGRLLSAAESAPLVALLGAPGSGKTALLRAAAHRLAADGADASGRAPRWIELPAGATTDDLLAALLHAVGEPDGPPQPAPRGGALPDRIRQAIFALNRVPVVAFLDPLDRIAAPERHALLAALCPYLHSSTLVVATAEALFPDGRDEPPDMVRIRLPALEAEEGAQLFRAALARGDAPAPLLSAPVPEELIAFSRGNPAALRHLARLYARDPERCRALALRPVEPDAGFRVGPEGGLPGPALDLLRVFTMIGEPLPEAPLAAAVDRAGLESAALGTLDRLCLLQRNGLGFVRGALAATIGPEEEGAVRRAACALLRGLVEPLSREAAVLALPEAFGRDFPATRDGAGVAGLFFRLVELRLEELAGRGDFAAGAPPRPPAPPEDPADAVRAAAEDLAGLVRVLYLTSERARIPALAERLHARFPALLAAAPDALLLMTIALASFDRGAEAARLFAARRPAGADDPLLPAERFVEGLVLAATGRAADAMARFRAVLDGDRGIAAAARFHLARLAMGSGGSAEARTHVEAGLSACSGGGFDQLIVEFELLRETLRYRDGGYAEAARRLAALLERASAGPARPEQRADIASHLAHCRFRIGRYEEAAAAAGEAANGYLALGMTDPFHRVLAIRARALSWLMRSDEALEDYRRCLAYARETGETARAARLRLRIAESLVAAGDLHGALRELRPAVEEIRATGPPGTLAHALTDLAVVQGCLGSPAEALRVADEAAAQLAGLDDRAAAHHRAHIDYVRGELFLALGRPAEAAPLFASLVDRFGRSGDAVNEALARAHEGVARFLLGDGAGAEGAFADSLDRSRRHGVHARDLFPHAARLLALAARGETAAFEAARREYLDTAEAVFPARFELHAACAELVAEGLGRGFPPELLARLGALFDRFDWVRNRVKAERMLEALAGAAPSPAPAATRARGAGAEKAAAEMPWILRRDGSARRADAKELRRIRMGTGRARFVLDFAAGRFRTPHGGKADLDRKRTLVDLLRHLALARGTPRSPAEIYAAVWGEPFEPVNAPVIHVNLRRLRRILEADPENPALLLTRYNARGETGYRLSEKVDWIAILPADAPPDS